MVGTVKRGRPRNEELIVQRQEEILAAATNAFAHEGFAGTDIQVVADALGIGKGTIYRYFPTKEELFFAAVDRGMNRLNLYIDRAVRRYDDPVEKIAVAIDAYLSFFDSEPEIVELLIQERAEFRDRHMPTYMKHREKNIGPWLELLRNLIHDGRVREIEVTHICDSMSSMLYGTLFTKHYQDEAHPFRSQAARIITVIFAGILTETDRSQITRYLNLLGNPTC